MKDKLYDYSNLRPSTITHPEYRHLFLLLGWLGYTCMYLVTDRMIPQTSCHIVHCVVDDWIPFSEIFVIPYIFWYVFVASALFYLLLFDVPNFVRFQIYIITTQVIAIVSYFIWPTMQLLRPQVMPRQNIFTWILQGIYFVDTPTGVCPSMHVAFAVAVASVWFKKKDAKRITRLFIAVTVVLICMSVCFVKQHSFVDIVMSIPVCIIAELTAYGSSYWIPVVRAKRETVSD